MTTFNKLKILFHFHIFKKEEIQNVVQNKKLREDSEEQKQNGEQLLGQQEMPEENQPNESDDAQLVEIIAVQKEELLNEK